MKEMIVLKESLKAIEKDLYKANTKLSDFNSFLSLINLICSNVVKVNKLINSGNHSDNELKHFLQKGLKNKKLILLFKKFFAGLSKEKFSLDQLQEKLLEVNLFFEQYRTYRNYCFDDWGSLKNFLNEINNIYSVDEIIFKPEFVGSINVKKLSNDFGLKLINQQLVLDSFSLEKLLDCFSTTDFKPFYLILGGIKLHVKDNFFVATEANNEIIKRLDRLAIEFDGRYFED